MRKFDYVAAPKKLLTPEAVENLCSNFTDAWNGNQIDKLILIPMF